ncbi:hypothetical protein [Pseudomonas moorei]|uniref:hypothetical protein n=1 Tax=Pseudomonas moorei TaxID=395599 RepID=UPI0036F3FBD3
MAIHLNDRLARILDDTSHNRRHDIWLWIQLTTNNVQLSGDVNQPGMRSTMTHVISSTSGLSEIIKNKETEQLLPEKCLEWINEGKRQVEWLSSKLRERMNLSDSIAPLKSGLTGKDLLIASIDLWTINIKQKGSFLNELETSWNEHKKGDKQFKWFEDDEQKCILAGKLINKHIPLDGLLSITLSAYQPIENHENLLIFFDHANLDKNQKSLFIERVKISWRQQKYRKNLTGKGQYNFILSDKAIARLDKLSETYELSRAKILDILLKMESEQNRYIPERIKLLKDES